VEKIIHLQTYIKEYIEGCFSGRIKNDPIGKFETQKE
jgi:hypothetical protein